MHATASCPTFPCRRPPTTPPTLPLSTSSSMTTTTTATTATTTPFLTILLCRWLPLILFASNQDAVVWVEQVKEEGAGLTSRQITFVRTCLRLPWGWWQWRQIILLRLLRQNNLAAVRFCSLNASRKVHWGEAIYFLEFRTKISSAKRILLIRTPLSTFIVTCDKIRQLSQSNPKQPTSGADEQWTMVPTFFLQVPWLLSPPKHQKTRIQIQKC